MLSGDSKFALFEKWSLCWPWIDCIWCTHLHAQSQEKKNAQEVSPCDMDWGNRCEYMNGQIDKGF